MDDEPNPLLTWTLTEALDHCGSYYRSVKEDGPPYTDNMAFLTVIDFEGKMSVYAIGLPGNPAGHIRTVMSVHKTRPRIIVFQSDSYSMRGTLNDGEQMRPGILAEWFAAGDPRVVECLMVTGVDADALAEYHQFPYVVKDDTLTWLVDDSGPVPKDHILEGRVLDSLRDVMAEWA